MKTRFFPDIDGLPSEYRALFRESGNVGFYHSEAWYQAQFASTLGENNRTGFLGIEDGNGNPLALLPVRWPRRTRNSFFWARVCQNYTNIYSSQFVPISAAPAAADPTVADATVAALLALEPDSDVLLFDRLNPESAFFRNILAAMERRNLATETFLNFGNWYEPVEGLTFEDYIQQRKKGVVRNCRKRLKKFERDYPDSGFRMLRPEGDPAEYLAGFKAVYAASWKPDERFPNFIDNVVAEAANSGALRMGLLTTGKEAIATRIAFCQGGVASLFKTAYRPEYRKYSPGLLIHWHMVRHLIENDDLREIEFGNGDEPHKADWASRRREFWGIAGKHPGKLLGRANILLQQMRSVVRKG